MKKLLSVVLISFFLGAAVFAQERFVSFSAGLMTGIPFYGDSSISSSNSNANDGGARIIIGLDASINFNALDRATFFIGNDILFDFNFNGSEHSNHIHLDFPIGIKVYPWDFGLNFGLAYVFGFRGDFINVDGDEAKDGVACWGNGLKFNVEYNFAQNAASRFYPSIGLFWKLMPRGDNYWDNMLGLYINANF